jgi:hypothetical protein
MHRGKGWELFSLYSLHLTPSNIFDVSRSPLTPLDFALAHSPLLLASSLFLITLLPFGLEALLLTRRVRGFRLFSVFTLCPKGKNRKKTGACRQRSKAAPFPFGEKERLRVLVKIPLLLTPKGLGVRGKE